MNEKNKEILLILVILTSTVFLLATSQAPSVDPHQVCEPNVKRCVDTDIKQCNSYGSGWNLVERCDEGCTYQDSNPICKEDIEDDILPDTWAFWAFALLLTFALLTIVWIVIKRPF